LLRMLTDGPQTLAKLAQRRLLYPPHADEVWIDCAEQRSIGLHLAELVAAGRVAELGDARFALCGG
jgi:hypothetical protein